jgi:hypothetical protein
MLHGSYPRQKILFKPQEAAGLQQSKRRPLGTIGEGGVVFLDFLRSSSENIDEFAVGQRGRGPQMR